MKTCAWCGEDLGPGRNDPQAPESCGKPECDREIRAMWREELERRNEEAASDNYERYH